MIALHENEKLNIDTIANNIYINEIVFIGLIVLCFIGDVIGEISDHAVILYWLLMTPVFFLGSVIIGKAQITKSLKPTANIILFSLIVWSSAFVSVLLTMLLWHSGAFAVETVGLIIHIILAHTMFATGTILGFRFYLIGMFLFIMAGFTIAMEGIVGVSLMLAIPIAVLGLYVEKNYIFPHLKQNHSDLFRGNKTGYSFFKHLLGFG